MNTSMNTSVNTSMNTHHERYPMMEALARRSRSPPALHAHRSLHSPLAVNPAESHSRPNSTPATPQSTSSTTPHLPHLPPSVSLVPPPLGSGGADGGSTRESPYASDSVPNHHLQHPEIKSESDDTIEELLLKWDDHHRSFFESAEDLAHNEHLVDVTLSCGEHSFPAHKLVLSVCSPYFRNLFLRNPCKHPIVVLKDVNFRFMKLLLMYMYRGEVSCPQEDLPGLLKTARSLQIRGLVELERRREAEGLAHSLDGSPIKRAPSDIHDGASTTSCDVESREDASDFNLDDVRSRLHGQLEIQPISQPSSSSYTTGITGGNGLTPAHSSGSSWLDSARHTENLTSKIAAAASSSNELVPPDHGPGDLRLKDLDRLAYNNGGGHHGTDLSTHHRRSPMNPPPRNRSRPNTTAAAAIANNAAILAAAQAAGMPASSLDPSDPMSSMNALLAAAQAHGSSGLPASTLASLLPSSSSNASSPSSSSAAATSTPPVSASSALSTSRSGGSNGQSANPGNGSPAGAGVDISQAAAVANLQLYYYMQKVASAGMGNPKERKECPICGKTLYDRSTWNRHMRIHTGEKPYPCRFCGRRFRTNYNKIGHEKKCPDRHARSLLNQQQATTNGPTQQENAVYR
eukprot:maker-scaffold728_size105512-snap-gene-0.20 protein:Tk02786 transcript:maker-scaffold728_size105512-snap-gene-0.20-mRNA-1 annotation:"tpa_inf: btb poz and kelch domain-containing protein"